MITEADLASMRADVVQLIADNPTVITVRRGERELSEQTVRLARRNQLGQQSQGAASEETRIRMVVLGLPKLNIQVDDRFNDGRNNLYRVTAVRPERQVCTQAEAEMVS